MNALALTCDDLRANDSARSVPDACAASMAHAVEASGQVDRGNDNQDLARWRQKRIDQITMGCSIAL
jgi:hypothetical protein